MLVNWSRGKAEGGVKEGETTVSTVPLPQQGMLGVGKTSFSHFRALYALNLFPTFKNLTMGRWGKAEPPPTGGAQVGRR